MKVKKYFMGLLLLPVCLAGCQKSDIMLYEQHAGVYFESAAYSYTFLEDPDLASKSLRLSVDITGSQVDYDREFIVVRPALDTITTAEEDQYKIGKGIVKANEYLGYVDVEVYQDDRLKDSIYKLALEIQPGKDFPEIRLNRKIMVVSFTKKAIRPANWNKWLKWYFGSYSANWWTFICEATGRTSLPYFPKQADTETWWMSEAELAANQAKVRIALERYNASSKGPLMHDDGPDSDKPNTKVTMPD